MATDEHAHQVLERSEGVARPAPSGSDERRARRRATIAVRRGPVPAAASSGPATSSSTSTASLAQHDVEHGQRRDDAQREYERAPRVRHGPPRASASPNGFELTSATMRRVEVWDRDPSGVRRVRASNPSPLTLDGTNTYVVGALGGGPGPGRPGPPRGRPGGRGRPARGRRAHPLPLRPLRGRGRARRARSPCRARGRRSVRSRRSPRPATRPTASASWPAGSASRATRCSAPGSVFIAPGEGSLAAYLRSLERLRELDLEVLCPGHGPYVWDPRAKLDEYIEHRLDRERAAARGAGGRAPLDRRAARRRLGGRAGAPAAGRRAVARGPPGEARATRAACPPDVDAAVRRRRALTARGARPRRRSRAPRRRPRPQLGTWASTTTPITVAVAGSSATISA